MVEYYYSAKLGDFIDKVTGLPYGLSFSFGGDQREWHEIMVECIIDVANTILMKNKVVSHSLLKLYVSPTVHKIFKDSVLYDYKCASGLHLIAEIEESMDNDVDFVDITTGEVLGTLHVLNAAPMVTTWSQLPAGGSP